MTKKTLLQFYCPDLPENTKLLDKGTLDIEEKKDVLFLQSCVGNITIDGDSINITNEYVCGFLTPMFKVDYANNYEPVKNYNFLYKDMVSHLTKYCQNKNIEYNYKDYFNNEGGKWFKNYKNIISILYPEHLITDDYDCALLSKTLIWDSELFDKKSEINGKPYIGKSCGFVKNKNIILRSNKCLNDDEYFNNNRYFNKVVNSINANGNLKVSGNTNFSSTEKQVIEYVIKRKVPSTMLDTNIKSISISF